MSIQINTNSKNTLLLWAMCLSCLIAIGCEQGNITGTNTTDFATGEVPNSSAPGTTDDSLSNPDGFVSTTPTNSGDTNPVATIPVTINPIFTPTPNPDGTTTTGGNDFSETTPSGTTTDGGGTSSTPVTPVIPATPTSPTGGDIVNVPTQCNTTNDIAQFVLARSQQTGNEFAAPCSGNSFYLSYASHGTVGCKPLMPYNIVGDANARAFMQANGQSVDLGFPSQIVGIHSEGNEMVGRAIVKGANGQCSTVTLLGIVVSGTSQTSINNELQAFFNMPLQGQLDRVLGQILKE